MGNANGDAGEPWLSAGFYNPAPPDENYRDETTRPSPFSPTWQGSYPEHSHPADPPRNLTRSKAPGAPPVAAPGTPGASSPNDADIIAASNYTAMRDLLQRAHDSSHGYIGGSIGNAHTSFRDPFVFLLHSNVDRLFAMWQTQPGHPDRLNPNLVYGAEGFVSDINDPMQPWAGYSYWPTRPWYTPENRQETKTCKHASVVRPPCYDTLATYPPTVVSVTPAITFNDVPTGEDHSARSRLLRARLPRCYSPHYRRTCRPKRPAGDQLCHPARH